MGFLELPQEPGVYSRVTAGNPKAHLSLSRNVKSKPATLRAPVMTFLDEELHYDFMLNKPGSSDTHAHNHKLLSSRIFTFIKLS